MRAFDYDQDGRVVAEIWYNTVADADLDQDRQNTINWTYDESGNLLSVVDDFSSYSYAYDSSGRVTTEIVSNAGGPMTVITTEYGTRLGKQAVSRSARISDPSETTDRRSHAILETVVRRGSRSETGPQRCG